MDILLSTEVLTGTLVGFTVLTAGLIILQVRSYVQAKRHPVYKETVKQAEKAAADIVDYARTEADELLEDADEESRSVVLKAGQAAQKTNEKYQAELKKILERYHKELEKTIERGEQSFEAVTDAAAESFNHRQQDLNTQFDVILKALTTVAQTLNTKAISAMSELERSINDVASSLEKTLTEEDAAIKKRVEDHIHKMIDGAMVDIEEYKQARVKLLDSHIERLVEDIATQVLHKKLTLDEHAELAQKALADAKAHHVL